VPVTIQWELENQPALNCRLIARNSGNVAQPQSLIRGQRGVG
jgi:hypothetical protein